VVGKSRVPTAGAMHTRPACACIAERVHALHHEFFMRMPTRRFTSMLTRWVSMAPSTRDKT